MNSISSDMTLLDVIARHRQTEEVFRRYDGKAGVCLCCEALFESIEDVTKRYGLDKETLLAELNEAANPSGPEAP